MVQVHNIASSKPYRTVLTFERQNETYRYSVEEITNFSLFQLTSESLLCVNKRKRVIY